MEYTKGEWKVYTGHDGQFKDRPLILTPRDNMNPNFVVAEVCDGSPSESQANARLIAAAPELYEALKGYVGLCGNTAYKVDREGLQHYWKLAQQALSKAEKGGNYETNKEYPQ